MEKYNSIATQIPVIRKKFNMLPSPKYLNAIKTVSPIDVINPRLELTNIIEKVKKSAKNNTKKNKAVAPFS